MLSLGRALSSIAVLMAAAVIAAPYAASAGTDLGPLAPDNPYLGPTGTSTMHGDAASSDVTPLAGSGTGPVSVTAIPLLAACPTILQGSDSLVVALCTTVAGQVPTVHLLDPSLVRGAVAAGPGGPSVARLSLTKGSLLGGVYAFLDNSDRLVVVDGSHHMLRIGHHRDESGHWTLSIDESTNLGDVLPRDDDVTGLAPDWTGNVWFATGRGIVGTVDRSGRVSVVGLPDGERVDNSISTSPLGALVATSHAVYQLSVKEGHAPVVDWRRSYNRGIARKPGQLSWGTGSTPTYFGPTNGYDFVAIVDNSDARVALQVYRSSDGELVCSQPVFTKGGAGSENSPIGLGNSVVTASTYGYPYPTIPAGAGPSVPDSAPFAGGLTKVTIDSSGGCHTVWDNTVRSAAVPHISAGDGLLYTVLRDGNDNTSPLDGFRYAVLDPSTGKLVASQPLPGTIANDTLQMSGLITKEGSYLQGTVTGILAVQRR